MRLDHLLSKEHLGRQACLVVQGHYVGKRSTVVAHGWNVDYSALSVISGCQYCSSERGKLITSGESAGHVVGCLRVRPIMAAFSAGPSALELWFGVMGGWSLFENCTVDASIFVSKCLRAYGGCLGTRSR